MVRHDSPPRVEVSLRARLTHTLASLTTNQPGDSSRSHSLARRTGAQVAVIACCASALLALGASSASASVSTPNYTATVNEVDTMARTVAVGFGTANAGGTYVSSPSTSFSVSGGVGHIAGSANGHSVRATLPGAHSDEQLQMTFSLPTLPTTGSVTTALEFRRHTSGAVYQVRMQVTSTGHVTLGFSRVRDGVSVKVGSTFAVPQTVVAGQALALQGIVAGGSGSLVLRARGWLVGDAMPGWQMGYTDSSSSRLQTSGDNGMYVSSKTDATSSAVTVTSYTGWLLTAPAVPVPPAGSKPGSANTGVPTGTHLTVHNGNMTMTTAGATYDSLDVHGFVTIKAANVTIKRSIIRGGVATSGNPGLVTASSTTATNFRLEDSELVPAHPSVAIDGMRGFNYTLLRVDIHGTVDGAKVIGNNVNIQNSWIHGTVSYAHDPYQSNGPSHNDAIQVLSGHNVHITGNTIAGGTNSGLQVTQGNGSVANFSFNSNWADGGACTVNLADKPLATMSTISVNNNIFGHTSVYKNCAIVYSAGVSMTHTGNTWAGTRDPVALSPRT
jgi:hypothetical protein